jgi:transposase
LIGKKWNISELEEEFKKFSDRFYRSDSLIQFASVLGIKLNKQRQT